MSVTHEDAQGARPVAIVGHGSRARIRRAQAAPSVSRRHGREHGEAMLLAMLAIFNESADTDAAIQSSLDLVTAAEEALLGEVWLVSEADGALQLHSSSTQHAPALVALAASGRALGPGAWPALVARVVRTGSGSSVTLAVSAAGRGRAVMAVAAGVGAASAYPIRSAAGVAGVLVIYRDHAAQAPPGALNPLPVACHHLGRFLERARAEGRIQESARELSALAATDALTGLKNRREFDRAMRTIPREPFAVLSIDVDNLKATNDEHGHMAGDALLRLVGSTLGLLVRGWDVIARVGGDEFAALLPGVGVFGAALVAERMRVAMHALSLPSGPVHITVGWSAAPPGADPASVWQRADECLYTAKEAGRDRVVGAAYERSEAGDIEERSYSDVVTRLLEGGVLHTMFQPIVDLVNGAVLGYEALARPEGFAAMDSVDAVFESARVRGQIRDLDLICRRRALQDARSLPPGAVLFLNMSAAALMDPLHGVDQLLLMLTNSQRAPASVVVEITEHEHIRDYAALSAVLSSYRLEGVRFAVDDVGEGHSTLELLVASGSEYLKLGRSLTMTSSRVGSHAAIEAILAFARTSGAVLIAEGVENEFVADLMKAAGIALGQGFGLGKPTFAAETEDVAASLAGRASLRSLRPRTVRGTPA